MVNHPLAQPPAQIEAVSVLPAAFRESAAGSALDQWYEDILRALSPVDVPAVEAAFERIVGLILPVLVAVDLWDLREAPLLARGLALVPRGNAEDGR